MAVPVLYRFSAAVVAVCLVAAVCVVYEATAEADIPPHHQDTPKLIYYDARDRGEAIRLAFYIGGVDFQDQRVDPNKPGMEAKLPDGQLPVLVLGNKTYNGSNAILTYAGRRAGLMPGNPEDILKVEQILQLVEELYKECFKVLDGNDEHNKGKVLTLTDQTLQRHLDRISGMLDGNVSGSARGKKLTVVDLSLYCVLSFILEKSDDLGLSGPFFNILRYWKIYNAYYASKKHPKVKEWEANNPPAM